jgi:uncharacterized protein
MKNAIILHGAPEKRYYYDPAKPSESNAHWLPWLQKELIIRDIKADTPEMPYAYEPKWEVWCREVERFDIGPETMLIGHSAGGGFWLRYLTERPSLVVDKVVLIGPWLDPDKTLQEDIFAATFDKRLAERTKGVVVFYSPDDSDSVQRSVDRVKLEVEGVRLRTFEGLGHFTYENLGGESFPVLLEELIGG